VKARFDYLLVYENEQMNGSVWLSSTVTDSPRLSRVMWSKCGLPTTTTPAGGKPGYIPI
jgi:hypothetical protein